MFNLAENVQKYKNPGVCTLALEIFSGQRSVEN